MPSAEPVLRRPTGSAAILAVIIASYLMIILDTSIVISALPRIHHALGFSATGLSWVQNAYTLAFGGLLLLGARAGDILGRRRMFVLGIALFTVASLAAGLAQSSAWLHRFVGYVAAKHALADELLTYIDRDSEVFRSCRTSILEAGEPLLRHAQEAGVVRPDANITDVTRMVGGIAQMPGAEPEQIERILDLALDGLRYPASR